MTLRTTAGALLLTASVAGAYPLTMDIGTFAIDNYWYRGENALQYMIYTAQNFVGTASEIIPQYTTATTPVRHPMDLRDLDVTAAAVTSTSTSYGGREYNDFLFFGGHGGGGSPPAIRLGWYPAGYGAITPSQLSLGVGYTRFFMANSCSLFDCPEGPQACWSPAFKGLKAMLGYRSYMWDNPWSWDFYKEFWTNWTIREKSLLNAHFDAVSWLFSAIKANPGPWGPPGYIPGYDPGCLSSPVPEFTLDHCRFSFKYVAHDYVPGNPGTGYYYHRVIGSPKY